MRPPVLDQETGGRKACIFLQQINDSGRSVFKSNASKSDQFFKDATWPRHQTRSVFSVKDEFICFSIGSVCHDSLQLLLSCWLT
jgi:hypothetical protein